MRMDSDAWPLESRGRKEGVEGRRGEEEEEERVD